jgi:hypothetical protein
VLGLQSWNEVMALNDKEQKRLAFLAGVSEFDDWKRQLQGAEDRISLQVSGSVHIAWNACLPAWRELGRVNDLSRAVRVPKYWPHYATTLGRRFAKTFRNEYEFLIQVMESSPSASTEYLCAFDLLVYIVYEFWAADTQIPEKIFQLNLPIPPVIELEIGGCNEFENLDARTAGAVIRRDFEVQYITTTEDGTCSPRTNTQ